YKIKYCNNWKENGFCLYGNQCLYAHSSEELRIKLNTFNYKVEKCHSFWINGICYNRNKCKFIHNV
ncbi:hypothetical protein C1645_696506, partial [Glomus cerebriforme]